jgi:hypothetical protein
MTGSHRTSAPPAAGMTSDRGAAVHAVRAGWWGPRALCGAGRIVTSIEAAFDPTDDLACPRCAMLVLRVPTPRSHEGLRQSAHDRPPLDAEEMIMIDALHLLAGRIADDGNERARHAVRVTTDGDVAYCGAGRITENLGEEFAVSADDACANCVAQLLLERSDPS